MPKTNRSSVDSALKELRDFGLKYPGAHTKSPWPGHLDLAVNDKTFAYLSIEGDPFKLSCKLPATGEQALMLPHTSPTPYGLGKSGWVTCELPEGEAPPVDIFKEWIDESYRAQAPRKLLKQMSESGAEASTTSPSAKPRGTAAPKKAAAKKSAPKKKAAAKKAASKKKPAAKKARASTGR